MILSPQLWLEQAKSDLKAASIKELQECQRRYFFQQAYEKCVKALGIASLPKKRSRIKGFESAFGKFFLHHHTPMTVFMSKSNDDLKDELRNDYPNQWEDIYKKLYSLRQQLVTNMQDNCDDSIVDIWKKIDATRPVKDINAISYRYPFIDSTTGVGVAPANYSGWSTYQGDENKVREAINELMKRAKTQIDIYNRST